jgi:predicted SAM-dependent methyltransferase
MHPSAYDNAIYFYNKYIKDINKVLKVIDFGSYDVNGTLRPLFNNHEYIGIDMSEGPNVDIVCENNSVPLPDNSCDVIVSSSNFEHDELFWLTFLEMCRLVRNDGYIYINAPSAGPYHAHPVDCWRFYADSWKALQRWAKMNKYEVELVETYVQKEWWMDSIGIFKIKK